MKIICFAKSKGGAASTRQRALGLIQAAEERGIKTEFHWVPAYPRWNYTPLRILRFLGYRAALRRADENTVVLLQRTLRCPEFLWLMRRMRPRLRYVISDFDDAVWVHSPDDFLAILNLSDEIWCGSRTIVEKVNASGFVPTFVPTLIRTSLYDGIHRPENIPVIGWVGDGYAHRRNLEDFAQALSTFYGKLPPFKLRLIGTASHHDAIAGMFAFLGDRLELIDWIDPVKIPEAISTFSIGIMPLLADEFNAGKSGLKILEYLTAGIPVVASDVGENVHIVHPPERGLLARTREEWEVHLRTLLTDPSVGVAMGKRGREYAKKHYDRQKVYGEHFDRLDNLLSKKSLRHA